MDDYIKLTTKLDDKLIKSIKLYVNSLCDYFDKKDLNPNELLTVAKAARLLKVDTQFIKELLNDPACPRIMIGSRVRLPKKGFLSYITNRSETWYKY